MVSEFLDSWPLFADAYCGGWLAASLLSLCGVFLVLRNQVFLGAAASEMSALGVALALLLGFHAPHAGHGAHAGHSHGPVGEMDWRQAIDGPAWAALLFAVLTCLAASLRPRRGAHTREAQTGWLFLLGASLSLLLVSKAPLGKEEVEQALSSTILAARMSDLVLLSLAWLAALVLLQGRFHTFLLFATEPEHARTCGVRTGRWTFGTYLVTGLAIGLGMHVAGFMYTFGCLLLPPLMARSCARTVRGQLVSAPLLALGFTAAGFIMANHWDFPPAQFSVGLMALGTPLFAACGRRG